MAFDNPTRNRLNTFVGQTRRLITDEFTQQFQSLYGIALSGELTPLSELKHLDEAGLATAAILRARIDYLISSQPVERDGAKVAVNRLAREQAFTVLNRLAAVRMAEKRELIVESVGHGFQSKGFQVFDRVAGKALGDTFQRYRRFLFCLFDELSVDLGVLFDRRSPQALLFPREPALLALFELINAPDLDALWAEDETIGWVYQYYNDQAERKTMREQSAAPRNSRELAVRNQFFTPRYVVEFLTDNTLGRIWYEMTQGATKLKEQCRYLVRRPTEIFLQPGDTAPLDGEAKQDNISQEDLLKQPVHIPHRSIKDPRTILMLDPACGSMHFGLYAFDLFEVIYDEAWALEEKLGADALSRPPGTKSLHATYAGKDAFLKDVPRLIIEHNLHGIDIDPRCAQIAGLSLWLRAQKAWQRLGLKPAERPAIKRSNIVCAEPMPGEKEQLKEFCDALKQPAIGQMVAVIFDKMRLAGEAGSLLKIEEEIRELVHNTKLRWAETYRFDQSPAEFFTKAEIAAFSKSKKSSDPELDIDFAGIADEEFWDKAEERIYAALRDYAEQAENGGGFQRRLFAEDAARGFAFIDVCRKRYDVALMNPPFGDPSLASKTYLGSTYRDCAGDVDAGFITRALCLLVPEGQIGAIVTRTQFFKSTLANWRRDSLLNSSTLQTGVDLGFGVLDAALVEAIAYVTAKSHQVSKPTMFFRALRHAEKGEALLDMLHQVCELGRCADCYINFQTAFYAIPETKIAYQATPDILRTFITLKSFAPEYGESRVGLQTSDNFRFLRLSWEVPAVTIGSSKAAFTIHEPNKQWAFLSKGGDYQPYFADIHLVVNAKGGFQEIIEFVNDRYPYLNGSADRMLHADPEFYFRPGVTYSERTTSGFSPRLLPAGCVSNVAGPILEPKDGKLVGSFVALLMTRCVAYLIELLAESADAVSSGSAARHYMTLLNHIPLPPLKEEEARKLEDAFTSIWKKKREQDSLSEVSRFFLAPSVGVLRGFGFSIASLSDSFESFVESGHVDIIELSGKAERSAERAFAVSDATSKLVSEEFGVHSSELSSKPLSTEQETLIKRLWGEVEDKVVDELAKVTGFSRVITKKTFFAERKLELFSIAFQRHPSVIVSTRKRLELKSTHFLKEVVTTIVSHSLGCAFGRWDIRYATGEQAPPELPDPFAPLPVCPPGQLQNAQGLPARPEDVPAGYPVRIPWDAILVDDPNHPLDIERRVREVIEIIWSGKEGGPTAEAIEHEACEILGVEPLRDYFRKPAGFFADHLKRYSKSRRQAPIYWPFSTASGSYTLWLYYHRLTDQTLHTVLADFLKPKIKSVEQEMTGLRGQGKVGGQIGELQSFLDELLDLHEEIERVIKLPWKPNLNDGVLITAAPLWKLFRLGKWQKDLKACWVELEAGDYDWAHLAYTIWPNRVREKCKKDRSLAIAHSLESICEVKTPEKKAKKSKTTKMQMDLADTE